MKSNRPFLVLFGDRSLIRLLLNPSTNQQTEEDQAAYTYKIFSTQNPFIHKTTSKFVFIYEYINFDNPFLATTVH